VDVHATDSEVALYGAPDHIRHLHGPESIEGGVICQVWEATNMAPITRLLAKHMSGNMFQYAAPTSCREKRVASVEESAWRCAMRAQEPIMATGLGGLTNEESRDLIVVPALLLCGAPRSCDESCVVSQRRRRGWAEPRKDIGRRH
jgi:hypothetical protein